MGKHFATCQSLVVDVRGQDVIVFPAAGTATLGNGRKVVHLSCVLN